jgi:dihydrolipoamide dehydrogenase
LVAVGAAPIRPPIPGADLPGVLVSDDLLEGPVQNPGSIVIIGGGVIGVEMASIYNNLGTQVTIIELADRLLPMLDKEISQNLAMIFKKRGIAVHAGSMVQEITKGESGLSVKFQGKAGEAVAEGEAVLLSTGRKPSLAGLFEGTLPKTDDRGGIIVDERYETSIPGIFAIGDCVSGNMQLAHEASAQGTNAVAIMAGDHPEMNMSLIPSCVYTDPEIATVGLSVDEAKKADRPIKTSKYVMSGNGKTMIEKGERGFMKLIFDEETEVLLGASFMCSRATDLVGVITALIGTKVTATQLASIIYPHPTFCEGLGEAVESLFGMAVHVAPPRR